jgi:hypothetical protein
MPGRSMSRGRDVGPCLERVGLDLVAALQLSDDLHIGLQAPGRWPPESVGGHRLAPALQNAASRLPT